MRRLFFLSSFFFLLLSRSSSLLFSVPPPPGFPLPEVNTCKVNALRVKERSAALKAAPFFQPAALPTTAYVALVRIDFSDKSMTKTAADAQQFMERMRGYFYENSYGLLIVSAAVTNGGAGGQGAYRMPSTLASYAQGICSNFDQIAKDAVFQATSAGFNFSGYNHIMLYHAGVGAETANDAGCQTDNIWSVFAPTVAASAAQTEGVRVPFRANGVSFNGVTIVPESESSSIDPLGVICHEYGHQLGLLDLYKNSAESVVGKWSLMDSGIYIGSPPGSNPAHMDPWSKQFLGFSAPQSYEAGETGATLSLSYSENARNAFLRVPITGVAGVDSSKEYFLIERRAGASFTGKSYDNALPFSVPAEGYLIWHIDDTIALDASRLENNTLNIGAPHYAVDVVEADGKGVIAPTSGKESDPFPGSKGKTLFAVPLSNTFDGRQSGVAVSGFAGSVLTLKKAFAAASPEISKAINFPNPGGPSYPQKAGAAAGTVTTLVLNATRPPQSIQLTIHDLAGALVRDVPESAIRANGGATATNKFVFEYDWDGRNDDGTSVASGIYLYRFKLDDSVVETGKLVIVR